MLLTKSLFSAFALAQSVAAAGYVNAAYFTSWGTLSPQDLNYGAMSHIIYAFTDIASNGSVVPVDLGPDERDRYPGDVDQSGVNVYGNVKQLYLLKKKDRKLKTLLSVGGYTASQEGKWWNAIRNPQYRARFVDSAIKLMLDWGMDGIDLDFEYPKTVDEGSKFLALVTSLRAGLDAKSKSLGQNYKYLITAAVPAGAANYNMFPLGDLNKVLDHFYVMTYDYAGTWSTVGAHHSNMYHDKTNPLATPLNTDAVVKAYLAKGVSASKIVLGVPLYGKSFANSEGLGKKYSGTLGAAGDGTIPFKNLPKSGATVNNRPTPGAMTSYDAKTKELVVFDGTYSAQLKATYVKNNKLAGAFFWEASGDKTGANSLVTIMKNSFGTKQDTNNQLAYPSSKFANMRNGMPSSKK